MNDTPSNARAFFEQIMTAKTDGYAFIDSLVAAKAEENEWREFKGGAHITDFEDKTKKEENLTKLRAIWSEQLGAFSNSSGGVLIWGIHCPGRIAEGVSLARDAERLKQYLIDWLANAVEPRVPRVEIEAFPQEGCKQGFVVCYIPESRFAPHRSVWPAPQFYQRSQDGSHICSYSNLRRLFQPDAGPILVPSLHLQVDDNNLGILPSGIMSITNQGHASAHEVGVVISDWQCHADGKHWVMSDGRGLSIGRYSLHPGQVLELKVNGERLAHTSDDFFLKVSTKMYARDTQPFEHVFQIPWRDLIALTHARGEQFLKYEGAPIAT